MKDIDLTKCVNLRFRLRIDGTNYFGRIGTDERGRNCLFCDDGKAYWVADSSDELQRYGKSYLEIFPRDPETYQDWQVGDIICDSNGIAANGRIVFRSGEFVAADIEGCICYTCGELFDEGYRLVLTDIERQIIEEKTKYEPHEFKKGEPVLVRDYDNELWALYAYHEQAGDKHIVKTCFQTVLQSQCIPYNERTMHLLGTTEDYREEE